MSRDNTWPRNAPLARRHVLAGGLASAAVATLGFTGVATAKNPPARAVRFLDGTRGAAIVTDADADDQVHVAATELQSHIAAATGTTISVITPAEADDLPSGTAQIHLGRIAPGTQRDVTNGLAEVDSEDGFVIAALGQSISIVGPTPYGTRYGAYDFLERFLGVRWLFPGPDGVDVPHHDWIAIPYGTVLGSPSFLTRHMSPLRVSHTPDSPDWTSSDIGIQWAARGRVRQRIDTRHNLYNLIPISLYDEHPEFFPLRNGVHVRPTSNTSYQPRFSASGIVDFAVARILDHFEQNPDEHSYALSINDSIVFSEDEMDPNVFTSTGYPSASVAYYAFVNAVATEVCRVRPDATFGVVAYHNVSDPPPHALHPAVTVYITRDMHGWIHPYLRAHIQDSVTRWREVSPNVGIYDYVYGNDYSVPRIYTTAMAEGYQWLAEQGVRHQISELYPNWGEGPKPWVYSRLLWNPDQDEQQLTQEWCDRAVGVAAGAHLKAYYDEWESFWTTDVETSSWLNAILDGEWLSFTNSSYLEALDPSTLSRARDHMTAVVELADTAQHQRRAEILEKTFQVYDASAVSYPYRPAPLTTAESATTLLGRVADEVTPAVSGAIRRRELMAEFLDDPVLAMPGRPRSTNRWSGWNIYALYDLIDFVLGGGDPSGSVAARASDLVATGDPDHKVFGQLIVDGLAGQIDLLGSNLSFDDDPQQGWSAPTAWRSTLHVHDGTASLRLPRFYAGGVTQRVPVTRGALHFAAWGLTTSTEITHRRQYSKLDVTVRNAAGIVVQNITGPLYEVWSITSEWRRWVAADMITAPDAATADCRIIVETLDPVHLDAASIRFLPLAEGPPGLINPGFEEVSGTMPDGWNLVVGTVATSTDVVQSGQRSVLLTDQRADRATGLRSSHVPVSPGVSYTAEVAVYNLEGDSVSRLYLEFWNAEGTRVDTIIASHGELGAWSTMTCARTAPAGSVTATVLLYRDQAGTGSAYFDDAVLIETL